MQPEIKPETGNLKPETKSKNLLPLFQVSCFMFLVFPIGCGRFEKTHRTDEPLPTQRIRSQKESARSQ
jgi:hypothetical protein